ncbi:hypothetical protein BC2926_42380 [Bacillus cereus]|nr:hypothetical protein BW1_076_00090 [Bacillus mycoides NBRC 101238 = DSM 11821]GCF76697.1 hypothetical protein BC2926_42380 [Bacillus cereus]
MARVEILVFIVLFWRYNRTNLNIGRCLNVKILTYTYSWKLKNNASLTGATRTIAWRLCLY